MEQQTSLFNGGISVPVSEKADILDKDAFGCCSSCRNGEKYDYRVCSDAGKCLRGDERAGHCQYRKNLENGRIFFGKNAVGFDADRYEAIRRNVDALPPEAKTVFDSIVLNLQEYNRCAKRCIIRNEHISELTTVGLFEFERMGPAFSARCAYSSYLLPIFKGTPIFEKIIDGRKEDTKKPFENKTALLNWLNHEGVVLRDILAEPYRFAVLPIEKSIYSEEYYQDVLLLGYKSRIHPRSPLAEDGLLSNADYEKEETRRVKLSWGYSPEEKKLLLAAVQDCPKVAKERIEAGRESLADFGRE